MPAKFYFLVMVILFYWFLVDNFMFLLIPLATVVNNSFTLCIICQAAIYFAMQRKIVPWTILWNLMGCRRLLSDGLFNLVKNLQFHLLVIRHILYMVTAFAKWWHSPHCLYNVQNYLSLAVQYVDRYCFMTTHREPTDHTYCMLELLKPVDSHVVVNQYLRQDHVSLDCFGFTFKLPGSVKSRDICWWIDSVCSVAVFPCEVSPWNMLNNKVK